jgi:hypothetical protein
MKRRISVGSPDPHLARHLKGASLTETKRILTQINRDKTQVRVRKEENIFIVPIENEGEHIANIIIESVPPMPPIARMAEKGLIRISVEGKK